MAKTLSYSEEIVGAAKTQLGDFSKIVSSMEAIAVISQETAAVTEEVSTASGHFAFGMSHYFVKTAELSQTETDLREFLQRFKLRQQSEEAVTLDEAVEYAAH